MPKESPIVALEGVTKVYRTPRGEVKALEDVTLQVERGEFLVVRGPSGSGKSTLLLTVAGMIRPTRGKVFLDGYDLYSLPPGERARLRAEKVGFVFQMFHLVPYLTVLENVLLPTATGVARGSRREAMDLLERFGLSDYLHRRPFELSVGEMQRVAIARALINRPKIILADEPTGNLDDEASEEVLRCLSQFHQEGGTVLLVTHEEGAERYATRVLLIRRGRLEGVLAPPTGEANS